MIRCSPFLSFANEEQNIREERLTLRVLCFPSPDGVQRATSCALMHLGEIIDIANLQILYGFSKQDKKNWRIFCLFSFKNSSVKAEFDAIILT